MPIQVNAYEDLRLHLSEMFLNAATIASQVVRRFPGEAAVAAEAQSFLDRVTPAWNAVSDRLKISTTSFPMSRDELKALSPLALDIHRYATAHLATVGRDDPRGHVCTAMAETWAAYNRLHDALLPDVTDQDPIEVTPSRPVDIRSVAILLGRSPEQIRLLLGAR